MPSPTRKVLPQLRLTTLACALAGLLAVAPGCGIKFNYNPGNLPGGGLGPGGSGPGGSPAPVSASCADIAVGADYDELGSGKRADPYLLCTPLQLLDLMNTSSAWNKAFKVGADIDISAYSHLTLPATSPIGTLAAPFTGSFDGGGHAITGFSFRRPAVDYVGFFGRVLGPAEIRDLTLESIDVEGHDWVGGLVALLDYGGVVSRCRTTGIASSAGVYTGLGGLVGEVTHGSWVSSSSSDVDLPSSAGRVGGLVGTLSSGVISESFATGDAQGGPFVGGLVGDHKGGGVVSHSYATGDVVGTGPCGGLAGAVSDATGLVRGSFATGDVEADSPTEKAGAITGLAAGSIQGSYYDQNAVVANLDVGGIEPGGTAADTTAAPGYFRSAANAPMSGWSFARTWKANAGAEPTHDVRPTGWTTCQSYVGTPFSAGTGSYEDPFLICGQAQLGTLGSDLNYRRGYAFKLLEPVNLTSTTDFPIGNPANPFVGSFDGNGKPITGLVLSRPADNWIGLFGEIDGSILRKVAVVGADVEGATYVGALVGGTRDSTLLDSYCTGAVEAFAATGGCSGTLINSSIVNLYSTVAVSTHTWSPAGGLTGGLFLDGTIRGSFATGTVSVAGGTPATAGRIYGAGTAAWVIGSFFDSAVNCVDDDNACDANGATGIDTGIAPDYFWLKANAPFTSWDFDLVWKENPGALPTLR